MRPSGEYRQTHMYQEVCRVLKSHRQVMQASINVSDVYVGKSVVRAQFTDP